MFTIRLINSAHFRRKMPTANTEQPFGSSINSKKHQFLTTFSSWNLQLANLTQCRQLSSPIVSPGRIE